MPSRFALVTGPSVNLAVHETRVSMGLALHNEVAWLAAVSRFAVAAPVASGVAHG